MVNHRVKRDPEFITNRLNRKAQHGMKFFIFGRVDEKHWEGNSWMGTENGMKEGRDWHLLDPVRVENVLPDGAGWLYYNISESTDVNVLVTQLKEKFEL